MKNEQSIDNKCVRIVEGQYKEDICGGLVLSQVSEGGCSATPPKCQSCGAEYPIVSADPFVGSDRGESVISMPVFVRSGFSGFGGSYLM